VFESLHQLFEKLSVSELLFILSSAVTTPNRVEAIALFKANSPWTDYAWASLPLYKESTQVSQLAVKVQDAEAELGLAVAQLQAARENKLPKSVGHDNSGQQALLVSQLRDVEARLDGVGVVRSPYAGTIQKIKWISQVNQKLMIEVALRVQEPEKAL
jgi:hypothetical protein